MALSDDQEAEGSLTEKPELKSFAALRKYAHSTPLLLIQSVHPSIHPALYLPLSVRVSLSKLFSSIDLYLVLSEDCFACRFPK